MVPADRRCVKPTFPRLPPNFPTPPATPSNRAPQFKLSSAPSQKDYLICFTTGATGGGRKKTSWLLKEREGWIKLDPPVPKELTREQPDCNRKDSGNPRVGNVESPQWRRNSRSEEQTLTSALQYNYCGNNVKK